MNRTTPSTEETLAIADIEQAARDLMAEPEWAQGDRHSRAVISTDRLRVVLTALRAGAELGSRETDDTIVVQAVRGELRIRVQGSGDTTLRAGQLAAFAQPCDWQVRAATDSLVLLTSALHQPAQPEIG
jgi:hypothetical protein